MIRSVTLLSALAVSLYIVPGALAAGTHRLLVHTSDSTAAGQFSAPVHTTTSTASLLLVRGYYARYPNRWKLYTSPDGQFTARFPTRPELESSSVSGTPMKIVQSTMESAAYMLMYMKLGEGLSRNTRQKALKGAVQGVAGEGKLISVTPRVYQGYSAREVILEKDVSGTPAICTDLIFIANDRLYQVMTVIPRGTDAPANTRVFQGGFKLSENQ